MRYRSLYIFFWGVTLNTAIEVQNLTKIYKLYDNSLDRLKEALHPFKKKYHKEFYALNNVSFEVEKGTVTGITGKNGSGKSTLLQIITGVLTPTSGKVDVYGKISALLELGAGFNPELTGMENIYFTTGIMGYKREDIEDKIDDIVSFAGIGDFIGQPVKTYSSGMYLRLAFSVAINIEPEILIIDEALAVGDMRFQQKCFRKLEEFKENRCTILFVSHEPGAIINFCDSVMWLMDGQIYQTGRPSLIMKRYVSYMSYDVITGNRKISKKVSENFPEKKGNINFFIDRAVIEKEFLEIDGWAYNKDSKIEPDKVYIILQSEDKRDVFSSEIIKREDVKKFCKLDGSMVGFSVTVPLEELSFVKYEIALYLRENNEGFLQYTGKIINTASEKCNSKNCNICMEWEDISRCSSFGDGGAEIKGVALYSKNFFKKVNILEGGEEVIFFLDIEVKEDLLMPGVGILLKDEYGNNIFTINNYIYNVPLKKFLKGSREIIKFEFKFPVIKVGKYSFTTSVFEGTQNSHIQHHWVHDACLLQVANPDIKSNVGCYMVIDDIRISNYKL